MISPYVRRLRLAAELRSLRAEHGLTSEQLAKKIGENRASISRIENGHLFDVADIIKILDALEVEGDRWTRIYTIAREASERGWWESNREMGVRQARYADLEAGATAIREFQMAFLPGLLQTPEFTRARVTADDGAARSAPAADKAVDARNRRQRMLRRPDGPTYDVIVDELAVRRRGAPAEVVKAQLYHITARANGDPKTTVRVLPVEAEIESFNLPRSAFSLYTYPDPEDPTVVAVDTVTDDLLLTEADDVKEYEVLYGRLRDAALSVDDSLRFLITIANRLAAE